MLLWTRIAALVAAAAAGQVSPERRQLASEEGAVATDDWGERVRDAARHYFSKRSPLRRRDCSGFIETVLGRAGKEVRGGTRKFWRSAKREGRLVEQPRPGDLVFFDRTYDANRNGRVDDPLTHIAVVTAIREDGTIIMMHYGSTHITPIRMNLEAPDAYRRNGRVINDFLRAPGYGPPRGKRLTGQLFDSFARPPRPAMTRND